MLPDISLTPGTVVHGRVLDARTLVLAGVRLAAQLPDGVEPGQRLRLRVQETSSERVHLRVVDRQAPAAEQVAVPATAYQVALPGGTVARVYVQEREEAGGRGGGPRAATSVVVRYDSPALGRLDVRLDRGAAAVHVSAGEPAETVRGAADALRDALARVTGAPVQVTVHPRQETLDVRA
ncbi:MAG: hypothetical protein JWQ20_1532 [Conexibacter sp.]|nr:hypothetical protein [Conexibacter sp.]